MLDEDLEKEVTKLERYLIRNGRETLVREIRALNPEQLKKKMQEYAMYRQELIDFKANDKDLREAKKKVSELNAPHNENIRANDKITRFVSLVIKDK